MEKVLKQILNVPSLAVTPPMGWSTWDGYGTNISEQVVKDIADSMYNAGLHELGYNYILIDEGWEYLLQGENDSFEQQVDGSWIRTSDSTVVRNANGVIIPDATKFPNGIKAVADYVHGKGFKLGIYSSPGRLTCFKGMGSLDYEQIDANTYASWGIDALKYDLCSYSGDIYEGWAKMQKHLEATGRDFLFYLCVFGLDEVWKWGAKVGHYWRICGDTNHLWSGQASWGGVSVVEAYNIALSKIDYTNKNGWNDVDTISLMKNTKTLEEKKSQMGMWCMLNLPLILGGTVALFDQDIENLVKNDYLLSIQRDSSHRATRIKKTEDVDVLVKPLKDGVAIMFVNFSDSESYNYSSTMMDLLGIYKGNDYIIYNALSGIEIGGIGLPITFSLDPHQCAVFKVQ